MRIAHILRRLVATAALLSLGLSIREVRAQSADPKTLATAQALYEGAVKAMAAKDYDRACPSLEEVVRLVPDGFGAKVTLAECYEASGRLASAWTMYTFVDANTTKPNQMQHKRTAQRKAEALKPKLARLTIIVAKAVRALPELEVKQDGISVSAAQWGTPLPVDRGKHVLTVTAKGKQALEKAVEIDEDGVTRSVEVADLPDVHVTPTSVVSSKTSTDNPNEIVRRAKLQRTLAFVTGGLGIVAVGFGTGFGIQAIVKKSQSNSPQLNGAQCLNGNYCTYYDAELTGRSEASPWHLRAEGMTAAARSTAMFVTSGVLLGASAALFLAAPRGTSGNVKIAVGARGFEISGSW